jgi:hypothetical protein
MCAYVCSEDVVKEGGIFVAVAEGISNPELYFSCLVCACVCMALFLCVYVPRGNEL